MQFENIVLCDRVIDRYNYNVPVNVTVLLFIYSIPQPMTGLFQLFKVMSSIPTVKWISPMFNIVCPWTLIRRILTLLSYHAEVFLEQVYYIRLYWLPISEVTLGNCECGKLKIIHLFFFLFAGTRYKRRGVDDDGNVANYVETEQVITLIS